MFTFTIHNKQIKLILIVFSIFLLNLFVQLLFLQLLYLSPAQAEFPLNKAAAKTIIEALENNQRRSEHDARQSLRSSFGQTLLAVSELEKISSDETTSKDTRNTLIEHKIFLLHKSIDSIYQKLSFERVLHHQVIPQNLDVKDLQNLLSLMIISTHKVLDSRNFNDKSARVQSLELLALRNTLNAAEGQHTLRNLNYVTPGDLKAFSQQLARTREIICNLDQVFQKKEEQKENETDKVEDTAFDLENQCRPFNQDDLQTEKFLKLAMRGEGRNQEAALHNLSHRCKSQEQQQEATLQHIEDLIWISDPLSPDVFVVGNCLLRQKN